MTVGRRPEAGEARPCRLCGMPIRFVRNVETGNLVPVQRVRSVFVVVEDLAGDPQLAKAPVSGPKVELFVNHYETCYRASEARPREKRAQSG